jgi:hypothetical protein
MKEGNKNLRSDINRLEKQLKIIALEAELEAEIKKLDNTEKGLKESIGVEERFLCVTKYFHPALSKLFCSKVISLVIPQSSGTSIQDDVMNDTIKQLDKTFGLGYDLLSLCWKKADLSISEPSTGNTSEPIAPINEPVTPSSISESATGNTAPRSNSGSWLGFFRRTSSQKTVEQDANSAPTTIPSGATIEEKLHSSLQSFLKEGRLFCLGCTPAGTQEPVSLAIESHAGHPLCSSTYPTVEALDNPTTGRIIRIKIAEKFDSVNMRTSLLELMVKLILGMEDGQLGVLFPKQLPHNSEQASTLGNVSASHHGDEDTFESPVNPHFDTDASSL